MAHFQDEVRRILGPTAAAILVMGSVAVAQPVELKWSQPYTGLGEAVATGVVVHNGAVYTTGRTHPIGGTDDAFILKHDLAGNPLWIPVDRTWGGSDGDGGGKLAGNGSHLYVCGSTGSFAYDPAGDLEGDAMTVKWTEGGVYDTTNSPDGWWTRFSGDNNYWGSDGASNVAVDAGGSLYVVGGSERGWGNSWGYVEQYDPAGVKQWHDHYGTSGAYHYSGLGGLALSGGYAYAAGYINDGSGDYQLVARKYTTGGALEWGFTWGDVATRELGYSVAVSGADVYVAGVLGSPADPNGTDLLLVKLHDDGASASFVGSTAFTTSGNDSATTLKLVDGRIYVVGSADAGGNTDSLLAAYDTDLNLLWDYSWGGAAAGDDIAFDIAVEGGVIYVAGMEDGYTLAYVNAYEPVGACCLAAEACVTHLSQVECEGQGGSYAGQGTMCACTILEPVPTVSEWGLVILGLMLATTATVIFRRQSEATA